MRSASRDEPATTAPGAPVRIAMIMHSVMVAAAFLHPHLRALARDYDVTLYVANDVPDLVAQLPPEIRVVIIPIQRKIALWSDLWTVLVLIRHLLAQRPALVHTVTPKAGLLGGLAAFICRVPRRIHTFQGEVWVRFTGIRRTFFRMIDRLIVAMATDITVVSRSERAFLRAEHVLGPEQGVVLGAGSIGGVDIERFRRQPARDAVLRAALAIAPDAFVFLFLGRFNRDKGLEVLAEAFLLLKARATSPVCLLLVGEDEESMAPLLVQSLGEAAVIQPSTQRPEDYIGVADALVLPSFREGFGVVLIEAAAMGVPTIASNIYGISCAVQDGVTGLLFPVGDAEALAGAMHRLMTDRRGYDALAAAAEKRARAEFDQNLIVGEFVSFYRSML